MYNYSRLVRHARSKRSFPPGRGIRSAARGINQPLMLTLLKDSNVLQRKDEGRGERKS